MELPVVLSLSVHCPREGERALQKARHRLWNLLVNINGNYLINETVTLRSADDAERLVVELRVKLHWMLSIEYQTQKKLVFDFRQRKTYFEATSLNMQKYLKYSYTSAMLICIICL